MRTKLEKVGEKFIYVVLVLWIGTEVLFNSNIEYFLWWKKEDADNAMAIAVLVLLMIQIIILQRYNYREMVLIVLFSIPIIISTINSNHKTMMSTWIFIIAAKYLDIDKTIKITYFVQLIMVLVVIYMFYSGVIDETITYRGNMIRHSLGFNHPNQLGIRIFQLVLSYCYIKRNNISCIQYGIIALAAWFIRRAADSKTSFYAMLILCFTLLLFQLFKKIKNGYERFSIIMIAVYLVSVFISVSMSVINVKHIYILNLFDKMMSRRFLNCYRTYRFYGVSIGGQDVQLFVSRHTIGGIYHFWLDNAYMTILLRYGVIVFLLFTGLYLLTMIHLKRTKQYILLMVFALYSIYGIMENNFFSLSQNIFLIVLAYPIYNSEYIEKGIAKRNVRFTW